MSTERDAFALFEQALDRPPAEREAFLDRTCAGDPDLRREVDALLDADARAEGFLEQLVHPDADRSGERVGAWRLVRRLGQGGMGSVYLAERADGRYERRAALKVLRFPVTDLGRRFDRERTILAALDHPHIARLLDAGRDARGLPFIVMEYVEGEPIGDYCRRRALTVGERIEVFLQVLEAVQSAHGHLVVHRDLKSSNILVDTEQGTPKLLDFGIAKLLDHDAPGLTRTGELPMTPEYASPEQVRGEPLGTASDIYSLGALLYELLVGVPPYRLASLAPGEIVSIVCETEPPAPSRVARERGGTLDRDLDHVLLKALAKDPRQRYATCTALADDLRRYLEGLPVHAVHAGWPYRAGKFLRRHRVAVASAALVVLALSTATIAALRQAGVARQQSERARAERDLSTELTDFLVGLLQSPDPVTQRGRETTVAELLDEAAARLKAGDVGDRENAALLHRVLSISYEGVGLAEPALEHAEAAVERLSAAATRDPDARALTYRTLGRRLQQAGRFEEGRRWARLARDHVSDPDSRLGAHLEGDLGVLAHDVGDIEAAFDHHRRSLAIARSSTPAMEDHIAVTLGQLALLHLERNEIEQAVAMQDEALAIFERIYERPHSYMATLLMNRAAPAMLSGDHAAAVETLEQALALHQAVYGPRHQKTLYAQASLGAVYRRAGAIENAISTSATALELATEALPASHHNIDYARGILASALSEASRYAEAVPLYEESLRAARQRLAPDHDTVLDLECKLAHAEAAAGRQPQGIDRMRGVVRRAEAALDADHRVLRGCQDLLSQVEQARGAP